MAIYLPTYLSFIYLSREKEDNMADEQFTIQSAKFYLRD